MMNMRKEKGNAFRKFGIEKALAAAFLLSIILVIKNLIYLPKKEIVPHETNILTRHNRKRIIHVYRRASHQPKSRVKLLLALSSLTLCIVLSYITIQTQSSRNYSEVIAAPYDEFWVGVDTHTKQKMLPDTFQITSISLEITENRNVFNIAVSDLFSSVKNLFPNTITPVKIRIAWKGSFSKNWEMAIVLPWEFCLTNNQGETDKSCLFKDAKSIFTALHSCDVNGDFIYIEGLDPTEILYPQVQVPIFGFSEGQTSTYDPDSGGFSFSVHEVGIDSKSAVIVSGDSFSPCSGDSGTLVVNLLVKKDIFVQSSFSESFIKVKNSTGATGIAGAFERLFPEIPKTSLIRLSNSNELGEFTIMKPNEIKLDIVSNTQTPLSITGESIELIQSQTNLEYTFQSGQPVIIEFRDNKMLENANNLLFFNGIFVAAFLQLLISYLWEK